MFPVKRFADNEERRIALPGIGIVTLPVYAHQPATVTPFADYYEAVAQYDARLDYRDLDKYERLVFAHFVSDKPVLLSVSRLAGETIVRVAAWVQALVDKGWLATDDGDWFFPTLPGQEAYDLFLEWESEAPLRYSEGGAALEAHMDAVQFVRDRTPWSEWLFE